MSGMYEEYCKVNLPKPKIHSTVKIWDHTDVVGDVTIGRDCVLGRSSFFYGKWAPIVIGERCQFMGWNFIPDGTRIGNNVFVGGGVQITNNKTPSPFQGEVPLEYVIIEDNVSIGANCTILPGVKIGEGSIIGAGSVVTKDIPSNVIAFGNPTIAVRSRG